MWHIGDVVSFQVPSNVNDEIEDAFRGAASYIDGFACGSPGYMCLMDKDLHNKIESKFNEIGKNIFKDIPDGIMDNETVCSEFVKQSRKKIENAALEAVKEITQNPNKLHRFKEKRNILEDISYGLQSDMLYDDTELLTSDKALNSGAKQFVEELKEAQSKLTPAQAKDFKENTQEILKNGTPEEKEGFIDWCKKHKTGLLVSLGIAATAAAAIGGYKLYQKKKKEKEKEERRKQFMEATSEYGNGYGDYDSNYNQYSQESAYYFSNMLESIGKDAARRAYIRRCF